MRAVRKEMVGGVDGRWRWSFGRDAASLTAAVMGSKPAAIAIVVCISLEFLLVQSLAAPMLVFLPLIRERLCAGMDCGEMRSPGACVGRDRHAPLFLQKPCSRSHAFHVKECEREQRKFSMGLVGQKEKKAWG